jgi:hypothetical protein
MNAADLWRRMALLWTTRRVAKIPPKKFRKALVWCGSRGVELTHAIPQGKAGTNGSNGSGCGAIRSGSGDAELAGREVRETGSVT